MHPVPRNRRGFLRQCGTSAGALFLPLGSSQFTFAQSSDPAYHSEIRFEPKYREKTPLDEALAKLQPGPDSFLSERRNRELAPKLEAWSRALLESSADVRAIQATLDSKFRGASFAALTSRKLKALAGLEVQELQFGDQALLNAAAFVRELKTSLSAFAKILTAEFQITQIDSVNGALRTRVRYELVGEGDGYFREQRSGYWMVDWVGSAVTEWRMEQEIRCRSSQPCFVDVTAHAFHNNSSYEAQLLRGADYWRTTLDGACGIDIYGHNGISLGDINGDGYDDVYVCQPAGLPNRLYRNLGDLTFEDITKESGVGILDNTACALFADFQNRGKQDLLVVRANGPILFLNDGKGKFSLQADAFRFAQMPAGTFTGAAAADYNRDGLLDVYFCLYAYYQGAGQYKYPVPYFAAENGPANFMMRNNGDGTFEDVTAKTGLDKNNSRYSFCCGWADYDANGWPDLYVVNDFGRKNLYRNDGDGTFTDVATALGVEDVGAGMSVGWADFENHGQQDLYVGNMWTAAGERITHEAAFQPDVSDPVRALYRKHAMGNSLYKNARAAFEELTRSSGSSIGRWAWASDAWDFDHDGYADIYIANGMISGAIEEDLNSYFWREVVAKSPNQVQSDAQYELGWNAINELVRSDYSWSGHERNVLFANHQDGTFSDVSGAVGLDFIEDSRAFVLGDVDGDGRQEVFIKNRNAPQLRLVKNAIKNLPPSIAFRLRGVTSNRDAIGASVRVVTNVSKQTKFLQAGSSFLSQHSKELFFGLGNSAGEISATVTWPGGMVQQVKNIQPNHRVLIVEGDPQYRSEPFKTSAEVVGTTDQPVEQLPRELSTWLLTPITAPIVRAAGASLICFRTALDPVVRRINCMDVLVDDSKNVEIAAVYNLLFRYLFDRHRNMPLPTHFLLDSRQRIVKVYQGSLRADEVHSDLRNIPETDAEKLAKALPFQGDARSYEVGRNNLSLGSIFFQHGYTEVAAGFFQEAMEQDKSSAEALYGLGSVYLKQGANKQAEVAFQQTVSLKASYPETTPNAWNNLGLIATRDGNIAKAVEYFERAIKADQTSFVAIENLGNAYRQQKRWSEARITLERALSLMPQDAEANYSLGMVFAQLDNTARAAELLNKALEAKPAYPEAMNNLAILYLRTQRRDEAVAILQRCVAVSPEFEQSYLNLARVYAIEKNFEKARAILNALLKLHPQSESARQALSQLP